MKAMDGNVLHIVLNIKETLEELRPASNEGSIVRDEVLSVGTAQGSVDLMIGPIHCP